MQKSVKALLQLGNHDRQIFLYQKELDSFPNKNNILDSKLDAIKKEHELSKEEEAELLQQIQERKTLIKLEKAKIEESEDRMFQINNQKEYIAIKKEIEAGNKIIKQLEDELLNLESDKEEKIPEYVEEEKKYLEKKKSFEKQQRDIIKEEDRLNQEIDKIEELKKGLLGEIEPEILQTYQAKNKRISPAVVAVTESYCTGCSITIPAQMFNSLIRDTTGECPHCHRILVFEKPEALED